MQQNNQTNYAGGGKTPPAVQQKTAYYRKPELNAQKAEKTAAVKQAMGEASSRAQSWSLAKKEAQAAEEGVRSLAREILSAYQRFQASPSQAGADALNRASELLWQRNEQAQAVRQSERQLANDYDRANKLYQWAERDLHAYTEDQENQFQKWKSTIRGSDEVQAEREKLDKQINDLRTLDNLNKADRSGIAAPGSAVSESYAEELSRLEEQRMLLQEEYDWGRHFQYADLKEANDFAEKSKYVSSENGESPEIQGLTLGSMWMQYGEDGFDDLTYDYINRNPDAVRRATENSAANNASALGLDVSYLQTMTDEEIGIFNYVYATQGKEAAYEYTAYLKPELTARQRSSEEGYWEELSQEHPVLSSAASVAQGLARGAGFVGQTVDYIADGRIDQNAAYNRMGYLQDTSRETVSQKIQESLGETWGPVGSWGYGLGMSLLDFAATLPAGTINGGLSLAIMGTGTAASTVMDAKDRGLNDDQAFGLGTIAGLAEIVTEKVSLDTLLDADLLKDGAVRYILKNAVSEGGEEAGSSIINLFADILISREQSEWAESIRGYQEEGLSESEAFIESLKDQAASIGLDALGGALSGGLMGSVGAAGYAVSNPGKKKGKTEQTGAKTEQTAAEAEQAGVKAEQEPEGLSLPRVEDIGDTEEIRAAGSSEWQETKRQMLEIASFAEPTEEEAAFYERLEKAETDTQISGIMAQANQKQIDAAQRMSALLGKRILFQSENAASAGVRNGWYVPDEDTIFINPQSKNPVARIIGHELTHSVELTNSYQELAVLVRNRIRETGGDLNSMRQEKLELYRRNGVELDSEAVDQEIVAEYVEQHLLEDEQSIRRLVHENESIARKILNWLDNLLAKMGNQNAKERMFVRKARDAYRDALQESGSKKDTKNLREKMQEAYRNGDDEAGDALFEMLSSRPGYMEQAVDDKGVVKNSFAGQRAKTANMDQLVRAKELAEADVADETIRQETGWFRGADGKWRWEIDDSSMEYRRNGDAAFSSDHPEYARKNELELKFIEGSISDKELEEFRELSEVWRNERPRLKERVDRGNARLKDILKHEDLFRAYPELSETKVLFAELPEGVRGRYNERSNTIVMDTSLRSAPQETLLHEVQHAIQGIEDFSRGASKAYWRGELEDDKTPDTVGIRKAKKEMDDFRSDPRNAEAMALEQELQKAAELDDGGTAYDAIWHEAEERGLSGVIDEYYDLHYNYGAAQARARNSMPTDLYANTAGELEARDAAERRHLNDFARKKMPPDWGNEDTVFAWSDVIEELDAEYGPQLQSVEDAEITQEELESNIKAVANMESVCEVLGSEFVKGENDLTTQVEAFFAERNHHAFNDRIGSVVLDRRGIKSDIAHGIGRKKAAAFAAVPDVIEGGLVVDYQKNWKQRGYDTAVVAAPITIGGEPHFMGVILVRSNFTNRFYVHEVVTKKDGAMPFKTGTRKKGDPGGDAPSLISILERIRDVKANSGESNTDVRYSIAEQENETDATNAEDMVSKLPRKAAEYLHRAETRTAGQIRKILSVPYHVKDDFVRTAVRELSNEFLRNGSISEETKTRVFDESYQRGVVVCREHYDENKDIKDYLRTTRVTLSVRDQSDIADFPDFKKRNFGQLRIVKDGGLPVDAAYLELHEMAPGMFPESITHPADQLQKMAEVANGIRIVEKTLDEHYGPEAGTYKASNRNDFEAAVGDMVAELRKVQRYSDERMNKLLNAREEVNLTEEQVAELWPKAKDAKRNLERVSAKNLLTDEDNQQVSRLLRGDIGLEDLRSGTDNVAGITAVYNAKKEWEEIAAQIRKWNKSRKAELMAQAFETTKTALTWKDKKMGFLYSRETMERNIRDIVPDKELAERIINTYFTPVHKAAADATKLKNEYRNAVKKLKISRKAEQGNKITEAAAVQILGEVEDNIRMIRESRGRIRSRDGRNLQEWQDVLNNMWLENPNLNKERIQAAVMEFRKIYDDLFQKMNQSRIHNGYEPVNYRNGYFPHFQAAEPDSILAQFGKVLGIEIEVDALPTSINGMTHTFKPGIRWFANALERKGFQTTYDAVEGFDRYIEGVADVIYQTENIQRLRALASQIRYQTTDDGIRELVDLVQGNELLTEHGKEIYIQEIYEHGRYALSKFVVELDEYTNILANKKSRSDRNMEQTIGRDMYKLMKSLEGRIAANMVAINPGSWLTNFIPITQGWATLDRWNVLKGMAGTLKNMKQSDGLVEASTFLTNRRGSDPLVQTWQQAWSAKLSSPMQWFDDFTAGSLVRGRYQQNLDRGMSQQAAMDEADQWAAGVMADRSKGATPTLFNRSNPLTKLFTQFQLEVNNQMSYVFKDIPKEAEELGLKALAVMMFKFVIGAFLYNQAYEKFIGRRPALDPIGMVVGMVEDLTAGESLYDTVTNLGKEIAENIPFVGGLLGGGRLPISSALPDKDNLKKAMLGTGEDGWGAKKRATTAVKELAKPATYLFPPFGGGQIKKAIEGAAAAIQKGSYSVDNDGKALLQYPVYADDLWEALGNAAQSMVFGKTTTQEGRRWIEEGFSSLAADETSAYTKMMDVGVSGRDAYGLIQEISAAEKQGDRSRNRVQRDLLRASDVSPEGKAVLFYETMASDEEKILLDRLREKGADAGKVTDVLMDIKDQRKMAGQIRALVNADIPDDQKRMIFQDKVTYEREEEIEEFMRDGLTFSEVLEIYDQENTIKENGTESDMRAVEFARWVDAQGFSEKQKDTVKEYMENNASRDYDDLVGKGMRPDDAFDLIEDLTDLKKGSGVEGVSELEKWRTCVDFSDDQENQMIALYAVMNDETYSKVEMAYRYGVSPESYVSFQEAKSGFDSDGNGYYKYSEIQEAIDSVSGLTSAEAKAALWQLATGATSASKNPYSKEVGQSVLDAKAEAKRKKAQEDSGNEESFSDTVMKQLMNGM